jgi:hypothetical protein
VGRSRGHMARHVTQIGSYARRMVTPGGFVLVVGAVSHLTGAVPSEHGPHHWPGSRSPPTLSDANVARSMDPLDDESHVVGGGHTDQLLDQSVGDDLDWLASVRDRGIGETA